MRGQMDGPDRSFPYMVRSNRTGSHLQAGDSFLRQMIGIYTCRLEIPGRHAVICQFISCNGRIDEMIGPDAPACEMLGVNGSLNHVFAAYAGCIKLNRTDAPGMHMLRANR